MKGGDFMPDFVVIDVSGCMNSWNATNMDDED